MSDDFTSCSKCKFGFLITNSNCVVQNCATINSDGQCDECNPLFDLKDGICWAQHCSIFLQNQTLCDICEMNFETYGNQLCVASNCSTLTGSLCADCNDGFLLHEGQCIEFMTGCENQSNILTCATCKDGWKKIDSTYCFPNHCWKIDFLTLNCLSCDEHYQLNQSNFCEVKNCQTQQN